MADIKEIIRSFIHSILGFFIFGLLYLLIKSIAFEFKGINLSYTLGLAPAGIGAIIGFYFKDFIKIKKETIERMQAEINKKIGQDEFDFKLKVYESSFHKDFEIIHQSIEEYKTIFETVKDQNDEMGAQVQAIHKWLFDKIDEQPLIPRKKK